MRTTGEFLERRVSLAHLVGFVAGLADLVATWWLGSALSDLLRPVFHATSPTPAHAALLAIGPLAASTCLLVGRATLLPWVADAIAARQSPLIAQRILARALRGGAMGELMAQGPQADEALRMAVMLDVRTGTVATLPLVLVFLARVTTWWLALALVGFTACSIPWYVIVGRRSARQALALNERRVVTTTRVVRAVASVPTLRGLGATDVAVVDVASATLREHDEAQRAIHAALGSSAISEFLAGVGVGLVAMILGFSLFRRSGLTGLHVRDAVIGVVLTAQFFTTWRSRGADFHARETVAATLGALRLPAQPPASGFQIQGRDVVTRAHGQPVSFAWTDGDIVHVQGPSGIGKSSLLEVAMGLALVEGGTLTATLPHPVFRVDTATALFATSVRDNITLGRDLPDLHDVCASLDLLALLERLDYPIAQLSDGERVRVLLARALAGPSGAIVLDDFTGTLEPNYHEVLRQLLANANTHFILEAGHGPWLTTPTKSVELR